ncbi:MAG: Asp-tRNA(Asn)/Glu-tRNA(Gln) amidotransferase subunit GatA [Candidatus Sungbacteria bacterium]|nr:Asp-tRNA(Asn)/Glu-tRNA(Gln) amidotransferase subunit GatA [Candidatus Sungbacteria bacterium]
MSKEFPKTISGMASALARHEFSAGELVGFYLENIREKDKEIRAYLEVYDDALDQARAADAKIASSSADSPLNGIPIAIKDNILIQGYRATAGSKILENYMAAYDATVIEKLRHHGAVFIGKTNMDEFAMGSSTENSSFGPTKNPHDLTRVPGGSSGGSAAAVAAGMCAAALGSDTGGSIRQPASFCGIVGLKPTYGSVSRSGLIAMASSLDQIGPLARSVADARIIFNAIRGKDPLDSTTVPLEISKYRNIKKPVVGVPKEYFTAGLDPEVEKVIRAAIAKCRELGAEVKEISLPHAEYALAVYYIVMPCEVSANLARFDGIRYGHASNEARTLLEVYEKSRAEGFGPESKRRIMLGTYALSHGYYEAYYLKAQKVRWLIRQDFERAFADVDFIVGPTAPTPPFRFGEKVADPLEMYLSDIYTVAVNLSGVPALSLPAGWVRREGKALPVGFQIIGKWFAEDALLDFAEKLEIVLS